MLPLLALLAARPALALRIGLRPPALLPLSRLAVKRLDGALELADLIAQLARARQLLGQPLGFLIGCAGGGTKLARDAVEGARHLASLRALGAHRARLAHGVGRRAHALGQPLALQIPGRLLGGLPGLALTLIAGAAGARLAHLPCGVAQAIGAVGQALLLRRQAATGLVRTRAGRQALGLAGEPALGVCQLASFELQVAHRAPALVGARPFHLARQIPQLLHGLSAARARLIGVLPAEVAGGILHLLGNLLQPAAAGRLPLRAGLLRPAPATR